MIAASKAWGPGVVKRDRWYARWVGDRDGSGPVRGGLALAIATALSWPRPATATEPVVPAGTATTAAAAEATVHVHLEPTHRGRALELFEITGETTARGMGRGDVSFRRACGQPCDLHVPARAEYFVASGRNTESREFTLDAHGDRVLVRARPGSRAAGIIGEVLTVAGALLVVGGVGMLVAGEVLDRRRLTLAGAGMLGGGVGGLAIGIPVELVLGHARVRSVARR